ncbi:MAG: hypothetical protein WDN04_22715 [Rhodospirillales bacterium]
MWPAMRPALPRWFRRAADLVRLLAVVLALAGQVAAGARAEGDDTGRAAPRAGAREMVFCQSGQANHPHDAPAPRHRHGCATMLQASSAGVAAGGGGRCAGAAGAPMRAISCGARH